jgi:hypothetical protein
MKATFILCAFALFFFQPFVWSQCPPAGFPAPGNTCQTAPLICGNIDGYCSSLGNVNMPKQFPGCAGWQLNNDVWIAFVAGTTQISLKITPSNCAASNNPGIQGAIYTRCVGEPIDVQCVCTVNPFILESNNFEVGKTYYLMLDGCEGKVCDYSISVLSGSTIPSIPVDPGEITGPAFACTGSQTLYTVPPKAGAGNYSWSLSEPLGNLGKETNNTKSITWTNTGFTTLCVKTSNVCTGISKESCKAIAVSLGLNAVISGTDTICNEKTADLRVSFSGQQGPWSFVYSVDSVAQPVITTNQNPYIISVNQPGTYRLVSVEADTSNSCKGIVSGTAIVRSGTLYATALVTDATQGQANGEIKLIVITGKSPYTYTWSNGSTLKDLTGLSAGTYAVTIVDANNCSFSTTCFVDAVSNAQEAAARSFSVAPNPTSGILQVSFQSPVPANGLLRLFDAQGRLARQWPVQQGGTAWNTDLGDLSAGVYWLIWGNEGVKVLRQ